MDRKLGRWIESQKVGCKVRKMDIKLKRWKEKQEDGQKVRKIDRKLERWIESQKDGQKVKKMDRRLERIQRDINIQDAFLTSEFNNILSICQQKDIFLHYTSMHFEKFKTCSDWTTFSMRNVFLMWTLYFSYSSVFHVYFDDLYYDQIYTCFIVND